MKDPVMASMESPFLAQLPNFYLFFLFFFGGGLGTRLGLRSVLRLLKIFHFLRS